MFYDKKCFTTSIITNKSKTPKTVNDFFMPKLNSGNLAREPLQQPPPNQLGQPKLCCGPRPALATPTQTQARKMTPQSGPQQEFRQQSVERVTNGLRSLKTGSGGQPIQLITNFFQISTTYTDWSLYQYQVDFNPVQNRINNKKRLLSAHKDLLGAYFFDGTMLFSTKKYKPDTLELTSKQKFDDKVVIIIIKFTSIIEKGDCESINILNLLLHKSLVNLNLTLIGTHFYDAEAKISIPKHKLQIWPGFETTIGMYDGGLLLQTELSTKAIREETVLDFLRECAENKVKNPQWMAQFKMSVIGSVVMTKYDNQTYRIDDVDDSNTQSTFCMGDGSSISYIDYYKQKYGISLSSHCQPLLISKKNKSFIIERDEFELVYLVPELCNFIGLTDAMKANHRLMADLEMHTRVGSSERIGRYNSLINRILTTPKSAESLTQYNLTLSNKFVTIPGRVLAQQTLHGNNYEFLAGNEADWTVHLCKLPMFTCAEIQSWAVLGPQANGDEVRQFSNTLLQVAKGMSFKLPPPNIVYLKDTNSRMYSTTLDQVINQTNPSFILCVIPTPPSDCYNVIKRLCINRSVPSQIVLLKKLKKKNGMSLYSRLSIKINCKLGGAPWHVVIPEKNMMIVGFDVCHDNQNKNKSYGALIATMNDTHTTYFNCVQKYESRQELSNNFAMSIARALNKYKSKNNTLPNSIIIYRDGVGASQLSYVHQTDVDMVKKTCQEFYGEKKVGLAFVIVNKCTNTRFFCNNPNIYQNPPPGTVIDNTVTDSTMYNFYLISHNLTKGTVTPTHYNVIWNTLNETTVTNFTPTIIQKLTYKLTHMSYSYPNTVRVPGPCQLAHKLASFTAQTIENPANPDFEDLLYFI